MAATMQHFVDHFEATPVVVLACLDTATGTRTPTEGASVYPACQNLLLAARALGYGGVLTMWHQYVEAELRDVLAIPDLRGHQRHHHARPAPGRPHGPVRRRPVGDPGLRGRLAGARRLGRTDP